MKPLVEVIQTRFAAYDAFRLFSQETAVAFLESLPGYGRLGRFSILALNPYRTLRGWTGHCLLNGEIIPEPVFEVLDRLLAEEQTGPIPGLPMVGGCIGYVAYDAGFEAVGLPVPERSRTAADHSRPLVSFDFYDHFLIFDQDLKQVHALAFGRTAPADASLAHFRSLLEPLPLKTGPSGDPHRQPGTLVLPESGGYQAKVEILRELIRQGEVYIANLTAQLSSLSTEPAHLLYERLRRLNPAPFAAFVRQGDLEILSASPERFIQIRPSTQADHKTGRSIETRPIKGTRPRSDDPVEDEQNARALLASEKDRSELLMIVDLERNDLSRICQPDSIQVPELFRLETYPTVFHLVATVQGILRDEISAVSALQACFPGGSITGAPKVAAMQIIDQLEDRPRFLYTGCLGYFSLDGQADFNILIRTIVKQGHRLAYGSGGGITWESDAAAEYEEMLVKAKSFREVLQAGSGEHDLD